MFGARLTNIDHDLSYRVEFDGQATKDYRVTVFDLPALVRSDLVVQPPSYTRHPEQKLENAFTATVIEGSRVTIACKVNKPLENVTLVDRKNPGIAIPGSPSADKKDPGIAIPGLQMTQSAADPLLWSTTLTMTESATFKLHLVDDRDRQNRDPEDFRIDVLPNRPPKVELAFPGKDVQVSPLEEFLVEGRVSDDIGLEDYGVVLEVAGREPITVSLGEKPSSDRPGALRWQQALEELNVEPDDLLAYHLFAVDLGPDGQPRRTTSDMFFAEVRPFEETFRQMDQPPGGQQQQQGGQQPQGNRFEKLIDLQKQIVSATFNLTRQDAKWSDKKEENVGIIQQSQEKVHERLEEMLPELQSAQQRVAGVGLERMTSTIQLFEEATDQDSATPLAPALTSAQGAYQSLLKLRARDHRVMQGQQSSSGSSSGGASPSEQQLQQLELTNKKNRYESRQSAANEPQSAPTGGLELSRPAARTGPTPGRPRRET